MAVRFNFKDGTHVDVPNAVTAHPYPGNDMFVEAIDQLSNSVGFVPVVNLQWVQYF